MQYIKTARVLLYSKSNNNMHNLDPEVLFLHRMKGKNPNPHKPLKCRIDLQEKPLATKIQCCQTGEIKVQESNLKREIKHTARNKH